MTRATATNITDPATTALDIEIAPGLRVRDLSSRAEGAQAVALLQQDINTIIGQLHKAERERIETGKPVDKSWRLRAQGAISHKRTTVKAIHVHMGSFPREHKPYQVTAPKAILDTIREELGNDEFDRLKAIAKRRYPDAFKPVEVPNG